MSWNDLAPYATEMAVFFGSGLFLWLIGRRWPAGPDAGFLNRELAVDILYQFLAPLYAAVLTLLLVAGLDALGYVEQPLQDRLMEGARWAQAWPLWAVVALYLLARDFLQYWIHRLLHGRDLWAYHAVHHAPEVLEWHHAYRFHPVNYLLYITLVAAALLLAGVPLTVIFVVTPFLGFFSLFVHSNLRWSYGPLRHVLTSPLFHRWHHSRASEAIDKNFAPNFPVWDVIFGTYYLPRDRLPTELGIHGGGVPKSFHGQMLHPFRRAK